MKDSLFDDINLEKVSNKKYKCGDFLSEGAFSKVYTCILVENNTTYVVKIQPKTDYLSYAVNEINILNKLKKHKSEVVKKSNIVNFNDYYIDDNYFYTIFEKCDMDLHTFNIMFAKKYKSNVPLALTRYISMSIINGIYELNKNNIIHCDIKSDNVLLKFSRVMTKVNGKKYKMNSVYDFFKLYDQFILKKVQLNDIINSFTVKLIDFNKSQFINQVYKDTNIQIIYYQAPEVVFGTNFNESVDMWSVGCIIYELITGHQLFDVYNKKNKYGEFYENYELQVDENSNQSSDMYSTNNDYYDEYSSYDNINHLENYVYLLKVISLIGPIPDTADGKHIENYLSNNAILGGVDIKQESIESLILKAKDCHSDVNYFNNNIKEFIDLLNKIFVYDVTSRITSQDIISSIS